MTVEDPIEYYIDGVGQTQVNTRVDMTFARGLRAILRQDPDVVMVGEIRDLETARDRGAGVADRSSGAVDAAHESARRRGHAAARHGRRAVPACRRRCSACSRSGSCACSIRRRAKRIGATRPSSPRSAKPADTRRRCIGRARISPSRHAGYKGRTGIYELVGVDETMRRLIHEGASEADLERHARARSPSILDDGWRKCAAGITSSEEVLRVTRED